MPAEADSNEGGRIYGFSNKIGHDRHIQNIIDHTNTFLPDHRYQLPRFNPFDNTNENEAVPRDDEDLDDFDLTLLGRPPRISRIHSSEYRQRSPFPLDSTPNQPRRVVGDASHHFRAPTTQGPSYQSPFSSVPTHLEKIKPSPSSQLIFERHGPRRIGELQPGAQVLTPPFYTAPNPTATFDGSLDSSSPTTTCGSSPSARLSLKQKAKVADTPFVSQRKARNLRLNLSHAPAEPPIVNATRLIDPRQALPDTFRSVFPYELFNAVQSKCFPLVYGTNDNVVVSAPTGSGKTAILEMAICKLVMSPGSENYKIVYQAPTKSLCSERTQDWQKKFSHMNLECIELTGDTSQMRASRVGSASIIVTTPEKWDSITRKWADHKKLLEMIRLVLIDEVHILKDIRGATLEAVVSRMKTIGANVRFIALSATVPNIVDIAKWLGRDHSNQQEVARTEAFGEELRPVKLQRYVYGYEGCSNDFVFERSLDGKLTMLLAKHSERKPIMIFCFTRKSCEMTARKLAEWWSTCSAENKAWPAPTEGVSAVSENLQEIVQYGVAFHHAGLSAEDRAAVARNFLAGQIHVICCTSTLAVGVNLPCHTVVLKGTAGYSDSKLQEYSNLEIMQMLGRAGRPQFDDSAVAIIMTKTANVDRYKRMISGDETLESTLHRNLVEHLNSEISLGTIQDVQTAKKWIGGTFLSVRVRQSPLLYDLQDVRNAEDAEKRMEEWCERDLKLLQQSGLVTGKAPFKCTEYGHAMSRYMVNFETMKHLLSIPRGATLEETLSTLCKAAEFKEFRFKPDERPLFRELNKSPFLLYPIKETLTQTWHKVFIIVQVYLGGVELPNEKTFNKYKQRLTMEKVAIFDRLNRLARCFVDCRAFDSDGLGTKNGLELARALAANSWENKPSQLSQIPGTGPVTIRKWVSHGVHTVLGIADRDFDEIERISSRNPPYGMKLLKTLENFPRLAMRTRLGTAATHRTQPEENVMVTLNVNLSYRNTKGVPRWKDRIPAATFIALTTDGNLAYLWRGNLNRIDQSVGLDLQFPVALSGSDQRISCYFSCEEIVGTQIIRTLEPNVLEAAFKGRKAQLVRRRTPLANPPDDDMDYGDLADEDMLNAVLASTSRGEGTESLVLSEPLDSIEGDFPLIDTVLSEDTATPPYEPTKMDNGKWMCNHRCRNGGFTATGKPCTHRCCHEGLDKPRPPPREKKKKTGEHKRVEDSSTKHPTEHSRASSRVLSVRADNIERKRLTRPTPGTNVGISNADAQQTSDVCDPITTLPNIKRKRSKGHDEKIRPTKKKSGLGKRVLDLDVSEVESIDLLTIPNDEASRSPSVVLRSSDTMKAPHPDEAAHGNGVRPSFTAGNSEEHGSHHISESHSDDVTRASDRRNAALGDSEYDMNYDSDIFNDEFPELERLIQPGKPKDASRSQATPKVEETLYPGDVQTSKGSIDYG